MSCREDNGVVECEAWSAGFHVDPFKDICNECRLADGDGSGCAAHLPSKEVTHGEKDLDGVVGGEFGPGGVKEGAIVADGGEVINDNDEYTKV